MDSVGSVQWTPPRGGRLIDASRHRCTAVAATTTGEQQPEVPALSADGRICAAEGMADAGREVLPLASKQSAGTMDPKAPGWIKRVRIGVEAPVRTPCPSQARADGGDAAYVIQDPAQRLCHRRQDPEDGHGGGGGGGCPGW